MLQDVSVPAPLFHSCSMDTRGELTRMWGGDAGNETTEAARIVKKENWDGEHTWI